MIQNRLFVSRRTKVFLVFGLILQAEISGLYGQSLGTWAFNGNTNGTPGLYNTVSIADFSPAIASRGYSGSVYYGETNWPAGGMNAAAYFEFSLTPVSGQALNILSLNLNMRRSNTGNPAGSGPRAWSIRSSVDGYENNLADGTISHIGTIYTVTPPTGFDQLATQVTFRVYGFNASTSSGGLSRLVFDNIQVSGSNIILASGPMITTKFSGGRVAVSVVINNKEIRNTYTIERSTNGISFNAIHKIDNWNDVQSHKYVYQDIVPLNNHKKLFYRICIQQADGAIHYSSIAVVSVSETYHKALTATLLGNTIVLSSGIRGPCKFCLYSAAGICVWQKQLFKSGTRNILPLPDLPRGIYYGSLFNSETRQTTTIHIP